MVFFVEVESVLRAFVSPFYQDKDPMHDLMHVDRVRRKANEIAVGIACDSELMNVASYLYGVLESHESEINTFLVDQGFSPRDIQRVMAIVRELQTDHVPVTPEGRILHDARMLEGDENFLITKGLVMGSAGGQSLRETLDFMDQSLIKGQCACPQLQKQYDHRILIAKRFIDSLRAEL